MDKLFVDIMPNYIYTQCAEPCSVDNRIVFQLRNPSSSASVLLYNKNKSETIDFLPIDQAVAIEGLSVIYFKFHLGEDETCLTTRKLFSDTKILMPDDWIYGRCYDDTIVIYPRKNMEITSGSQMEFAISQLKTTLIHGGVSVFEIKYLNVDTCKTESDYQSIYKVRHPLYIRKFGLDRADTITGFRDTVSFSWLVLGMDKALFSPGDREISDSSGEYKTMLLKRTEYTLTAKCDHNQVTKPCELIPLEASILSFSCNRKTTGDTLAVTFTYQVKNTRHAFLTKVGRIPIDSSGKGNCVVTFDGNAESIPSTFQLSVENQNGLITKTCEG